MSDLSAPAVAALVSAGVSGVIALVGLWVNRSTTIRVSRERFDFEKTLAEQKQSAELQLAERKFQYPFVLHQTRGLSPDVVVAIRSGAVPPKPVRRSD